MKILVVNDDGIKAAGIERLARFAKKYGEVFVVAPMVDTPVMTLGKKSMPFIGVFLVAIFLIAYIPALSLFLI